MLAELKKLFAERKQRRLAIEQCRVRYAIRCDELKAKRAWEDAQALAARRIEDWDLQAAFERECMTLDRPAPTLANINDVRFK